MNRSESIASLAAALAKAQAKLKNPHFDSTNPHFKSKFASLAAVREAVIPTLAAHGLSLSQWPVSNGNYAGCVNLLAHDSGSGLRRYSPSPSTRQTPTATHLRSLTQSESPCSLWRL